MPNMKYAILELQKIGDPLDGNISHVDLVIINNEQIEEVYTTNVRVSEDADADSIETSENMPKPLPTLEDTMTRIVPLLADCILVGYEPNEQQIPLIQRALQSCGYLPFSGRAIDVKVMSKVLFPAMSNTLFQSSDHRLDSEEEQGSVVQLIAELWLKCLEKLTALPLLTIQRLEYLFAESENEDLKWFFGQLNEHRQMHTLIDSDEQRYYRQFALSVTDWTDEKPDFEPKFYDVGEGLPSTFPLFKEQLKASWKEIFTEYEERPGQEQMIEAVYDAMDGQKHLLVEAGTGTGKSMGYLIPALYYGLQNEKKVIVSTHTIPLQEQLRTRDLPLLQQLFPVPFRSAVLKGRSHYLCLRKFEHKINEQDFVGGEDDLITSAQMVVWLGETMRGDEDEIAFGPKGAEYWSTVASDTDSCLNRACPWFRKCFYHRARNDAQLADVVITNHSLLFTDAKADFRLLPSYDQLVVDEAHQLEEVAAKHFGIEVTYFNFLNPLLHLYRDQKTGKLPALQNILLHEPNEEAGDWSSQIQSIYEQIVKAKEQWDVLTELLYELTLSSVKGEPSGSIVLRLKEDELHSSWEDCKLVEDNIHIELGEICKKIDRLLLDMKDIQDDLDPIAQGIIVDVGGLVNDVQRRRADLRFFMKQSDENFVFWLEVNPMFKSRSIQCIAAPIDVSPMMKHHFFNDKESVIMTSATLAVEKSFDYIRDQIGLNEAQEIGKLQTVKVASPFRFREQALVVIPRDFPSIQGSTGGELFLNQLVETIAGASRITNGKMLVLFTSYQMLKETYRRLHDLLDPAKMQVLGQGIDSHNRSKLIELFQQGKPTILLGTSSFWEGVDIPGSALTCLAIVRLPFQPPTHPIAEAKSARLKAQQKNPFMQLAVPQAVIRFKQGFGRLVRTTKDRGIVIVFDTRVLETRYGKHFLYSLPGPKMEHMSTKMLLPRMKEWMEEQKDGEDLENI